LHHGSTPQASVTNATSVMPVSRHILSVSRQRHVSTMPHVLRALFNSGPVKLRNSTSPEGSLRFQPLLRPSSTFSLLLCLRITWTILRSFPCINSGPPMLPVPHLSLFWLWEQVSLHLYIVRDLLTSGFGHRSTAAQVAFDIPHSSLLVRCTSARDTELGVLFRSNLHVCICGADGPGLTMLDGSDGKSGKSGCRLHCPFKGRRKPGGSHYHFALQRPDDYAVPGCLHENIDPADIAAWVPSQKEYMKNLDKLLRARNQAEYERLRLKTGLVKPSLLLGFC
jgi:hypothetical protein